MTESNRVNCRLILGLVLLVLATACCTSCSDSASNAPQTLQNGGLRQGVVKPGYGFPSCHLGMPIDDLTGSWQKEKDAYADDEYVQAEEDRDVLYNVEEGIFLTHKKGKVWSIVLSYPPADTLHSNSDGKTTEGIDKSSSISDVFASYGEPDSISNIVQFDTGKRLVDLWYYTKGIHFSFINGLISSVAIFERCSLPLDPLFMKDIGDTRELRQMAREVGNQKSEKIKAMK